MGFWLPRLGAYSVCVLVILGSVQAWAEDDLGFGLLVMAFNYLPALLASQMIARLTFPPRWKAETIEISFSGEVASEPYPVSKWSCGVGFMSVFLWIVHGWASLMGACYQRCG